MSYVNKIIKESYTPSSSQSSNRDQAFVLLSLSIGTAKLFDYKMVKFNMLPEADEKKMLDAGEELILGTLTPEAYIDKFIDLSDADLTDVGKNQIMMRLQTSYASRKKDITSTEKETNKEVAKNGTLKEDVYFPQAEQKPDLEPLISQFLEDWGANNIGNDPDGSPAYYAVTSHGIQRLQVGSVINDKYVSQHKRKPRLDSSEMNSIMTDEWKESAQDVIEDLREKFGVEYELTSVGPKGFTLWSKQQISESNKLKESTSYGAALDKAEVGILDWLNTQPENLIIQYLQDKNGRQPYPVLHKDYMKAARLLTDTVDDIKEYFNTDPSEVVGENVYKILSPEIIAPEKNEKWIDPAGGEHNGNDDPARMYEDSDTDILTEAAVDENKIVSFLQSNPHTSYNSILDHLGINPKSGAAIPVYTAVKKLLTSGTIQREQGPGRGFVYSVSGSAPMSKQAPAAPAVKASQFVNPPSAIDKVVPTGAPRPQAGDIKAQQPYKATPSVSTAPVAQAPTSIENLSPKKIAGLLEKIKAIIVKRGWPVKDISTSNSGDYSYISFENADGRTQSVIFYTRGTSEGRVTSSQKRVTTLPELMATLPAKKTSKQLKQDAYEASIPLKANNLWRFEGRWEKDGSSLSLSTNDRGPRTDHGGDDGEGWMSSSEIRRASAPYHKKWDPRIKEFVKTLRANKIKAIGGYMEYGEKGHISLVIDLKK